MRSSFSCSIWVLLGLLFAVQRAEAAIVYVQGSSSAGLGASRAISYPGAQSGGSLNVVIVTWAVGAILTDLSDSAGGTYTLAGTTAASGGLQAVYYAKNVAAAGSNVVTATFDYSTYSSVVILQYTGLHLTTPFDGFADGSGAGTAATSAAAIATSTESLVLGAISTSSGTATAGTGFTARINTTSAGGMLAEDRTVTAVGSYAADAPLQTTGANWVAQVIIFRGAGADGQAPTAPTNLTATAASNSQVNLSWTASTDNVGVTGYRVERCQGTGCSSFSQIATPSGTTFSDTGLTASASYSYRVRAQDAVPNLSGYSNTASTTTLSTGDTQAPTTPTGLTIVAASSNEIDIAWNASTDNVGVAAYVVERCQSAGCSSWVVIATPAVTRFNDTSRAPSTSYSYRVSARDAVPNTSSPSTGITYVTPASSPDCN